MMSVSPQWPWQRIDAARRNLAILALVLISASGFVSGLVLRPVLQSWVALGTHAPAQAMSPTGPAATTAPTVAPAITPQLFGATLALSPRQVRAGDTLMITAQTLTAQNANPASGVSCAIDMAGLSGAALSPRLTDDAGAATWTLIVPNEIAKGAHQVTLRATWGQFSASFQVNVVVA